MKRHWVRRRPAQIRTCQGCAALRRAWCAASGYAEALVCLRNGRPARPADRACPQRKGAASCAASPLPC